jgi:hypothetical protein
MSLETWNVEQNSCKYLKLFFSANIKYDFMKFLAFITQLEDMYLNYSLFFII